MIGAKLGFIGAGVAGTVLATALAGQGYPVVAVGSRTRASAERLATHLPDCVAAEPQEVAAAADLVFVTTPDDAIAGVVAGLGWRAGQAVVHCSGAASTDILEPARAAGALVGGFHPLQTFASPEQGLRHLPGAAFGLEAEEPLFSRLVELATALGGSWVRLRPEDKVLYHASAVLVSNYLVALVKMATDLWRGFGADTPEATRALLPLLRGTVDNLARVGLPRCLTGPIARGDVGTVEQHLGALEGAAPGLLAAYRELGLQAIPIARAKGTIDAARAEALGAVLHRRRARALPLEGDRPVKAGESMYRTMLKGKIHRARVTGADLHYEGSITIDAALLEAAGILPYELVHVLDVDNGARLQTYAIAGGPGEVCINGAAARLIAKGDTVIILAYAQVADAEARDLRPRKVHVDEGNRIRAVD